MNNKKKQISENKTKYGEVIPTMFSWTSLSDQKKRAEELDYMTKSKQPKDHRK